MKTDKLYNNILSLIYNVLKTAKLRKEMRLNKTLREHVIKQINNLLGIEKDYRLENNSNLSIIIAQIIVNQLGTEEQIEKPDNSILENFLDDYNSLIKFIDSNFPDLLFSTNFNENEIVNENLIKSLPDFIKKQDEDLEKLSINSNDDSSKINNNKTNKIIKQTENTQSKQSNSNFNQTRTGTNFNHNNANQFGLPQNPLTNPNFYPYKTKPKIMHNLKLVSFGLYSLITFMIVFLYFYSDKYLGITIYSNIPNPSTSSSFVTKSIGKYTNQVFLPYTLFHSILIPMLFFMTTVFLGFSVFGQKNAKREKFHLSYAIIGSSTILLFIVIYYVSSYSLPSLFTNKILDVFRSNIKWDSTTDPDYLTNLTKSVDDLAKTNQYKISNYLSIGLFFLTISEIIVLILIMIYNPKIDQQKIRRAQFEYQKLIEARFNGQDYEIDPTLFDDDDEDDQSDKKNN